ncbi:hypothetical protein CPAV1605_97 [seawater metagenome]|uniref:Uncharacterized protein n=1 Tax=seawater metagenome TaxID=1561972 RepID=A0A5E8CKS1_9ZZZZ
MGNITQKNTLSKISNRIFNSSIRIKDEYTYFMNDYYTTKIDSNHINGGISSGVGSSEKYVTNDNIKISINYDITFIKLLRERQESLNEWVANINELKKELPHRQELKYDNYIFANDLQKKSFLKRFAPVEEELTLEELKYTCKVPSRISWGKRSYYMQDKLRTLFEKHGFENYKEHIQSLIKLLQKEKGICTSDLRTYLKVLDNDNQKILNQSDVTKEFYVNLTLSSCKEEHKMRNELVKESMEKKIKNKYLLPIYFTFTLGMKAGDMVMVKYGFKEDDIEWVEEFEWEIPDNFLSNYQVGQQIILPEDEIPIKIKYSQYDKWSDQYFEAIKKIPKVPEIKEKIFFSFNLDEKDQFNNFIENKINEFIDNRIIYEVNGLFGDYQLTEFINLK